LLSQSRTVKPDRIIRKLDQRCVNQLSGKASQEIAHFGGVSGERSQCFANLRIEVSFEHRDQLMPDPVSSQRVVVIRRVRPKHLPDLNEPGFEFRSANLEHWPNQLHAGFGRTIFQRAAPEHPPQASDAGSSHEMVKHRLRLIVCGMGNGDRSALLFPSKPEQSFVPRFPSGFFDGILSFRNSTQHIGGFDSAIQIQLGSERAHPHRVVIRVVANLVINMCRDDLEAVRRSTSANSGLAQTRQSSKKRNAVSTSGHANQNSVAFEVASMQPRFQFRQKRRLLIVRIHNSTSAI
jgi:hypothetical protein